MRAQPVGPSSHLRLGILATALAATALALATPVALAQPAPSSDCPLDFMVTQAADGSVHFHWSSFGGADGYQVFGRQGMGDSAAQSPMLNGDARDFTRTDLAGNSTFWVTAYHSGTVVASSCERTIDLGPGMAPACPARINATYQPPAIVVSWTSIPGATGYRISRSVDGATPDDNYATAQSSATSFTDSQVSPGHTYTYRVAASNTRLPPAACQAASAQVPGASVPMFPSEGAWVAALAGCGVAGVLLARRR